MFHRWVGALVGLAFFGMVATAQATLITDTVNCDVVSFGTNSCSSAQAVVGGGAEFQLIVETAVGVFTDIFAIDIGSSSFTMTALTGVSVGTGSTVTISSLDWVDDTDGILTGIDNFNTTVQAGIAVGDISFTDHSVVVDFSSSNWGISGGQLISFTLVTDHTDADPVPEPSTLAIFGIGLAGGWAS